MTADELRALQAPLKAKYKEDKTSAVVPFRARVVLDQAAIRGRIDPPVATTPFGLHPGAAGDGRARCPTDALLESLAGCAAVTLGAVTTAMSIPLESAAVEVKGDLDFRGTLGVDRETPVGLPQIRVQFLLKTSASDEQLAKVVSLVERYCVVFQTLRGGVEIVTSYVRQ